MFTHSFIQSKKEFDDGIAARAKPTCKSVRRSPACSGEYTYEHAGFRVFKGCSSVSSYAENIISDFRQVYEEGNHTLPYHAALTALHHKSACSAVNRFLNHSHVLYRLIMSETNSTQLLPASHASAVLDVEEDHSRSQHLLDLMQFQLPSAHSKRTVIFRSPGVGAITFDPTKLPAPQRFIKTCCLEPSSADACGCHIGTKHESVRYVNSLGESILVNYYGRKNDYFNAVYRMWGDLSSGEKVVPMSPKGTVSETDVFPYQVNEALEIEVQHATEAKKSGFTYVWKDKTFQRRFERRQRRRDQLASGELPKYGLITVDVRTIKLRAAMSHVMIPGRDEELRQSSKTCYETIRNKVHARAIEQGTLASPAPVPVSAPVPNFTDKVLQHSILELYKRQSVDYIQRPLTDESLCIVHAVVRAQVTEISALRIYQRQRLTASASMAALIAIRFGMERIDSAITNLNHRVIQHILRRASGSMAHADYVTAPYIKITKHLNYISKSRQLDLKQHVEERYDANTPGSLQPKSKPSPHPKADFIRSECTFGGPIKYHSAKYYAEKCLELIGNEGDAKSAERWNYLQEQVRRVRKGEIAAHEVLASSKYDNWVYAIHYTYKTAVGMFLAAVDSHRNVINSWNRGARYLTWRNSHIRNNDPVYVQTVQIVHEMYRFMLRTMTIISPRYIAVFGLTQRYVNTVIQKTKFLAYNDGDEMSALMFGFLVPSLMTPDIHLDIYVEGHVFQDNRLCVKMSDPVFGPLKNQFKSMIPSRHTGTIDRATLLNDIVKRYRS
jgi:hypothetical protein